VWKDRRSVSRSAW